MRMMKLTNNDGEQILINPAAINYVQPNILLKERPNCCKAEVCLKDDIGIAVQETLVQVQQEFRMAHDAT